MAYSTPKTVQQERGCQSGLRKRYKAMGKAVYEVGAGVKGQEAAARVFNAVTAS